MLNSNCMLLDNSVLAPNTIVPSNCIYGGNPAVYIRTMSEQAQSQIGVEIELRFNEMEQDLTAHLTKQKVNDKDKEKAK